MPTTDDYGQGINIASLTDAPDAEKLAKELANKLASRSLLRFASSSARGATLTGAVAPVDGMASYLQDVNRLDVYNGSSWVTPEPSLTSTTTGLSAASGWTRIDFYGFRQGRVTTIDIYITRTGPDINSVGGNIGDIVVCTLPSGWRPTHDTINGHWDNGGACGGWVVGTDGICTLRTSSADIVQGTDLRMHVVFIKTT
ncbi:hypothetical protein ACIGXF_16465 [Streptomyces sp. NPDC053086]|uniref:hypothetical protein n=1 Tax=unclassified Streptomyces TaxID=2593676 RepID=UPI0037D80612